MRNSLETFLEEVAHRGSWIGGGSLAALSAALAAALLEKLLTRQPLTQKFRRIRRGCLALVEEDARRFAEVIRSTRRSDRRAFSRSLKRATEIPCRVFTQAKAIQNTAQKAQRFIPPRLQSDLRCALALAKAAEESAAALIKTNLDWLDEPVYIRQTRRRLRTVAQAHARPRVR